MCRRELGKDVLFFPRRTFCAQTSNGSKHLSSLKIFGRFRAPLRRDNDSSEHETESRDVKKLDEKEICSGMTLEGLRTVTH